MAHSRSRLILGILSLISLVSSTYFLSALSSNLTQNTPFYSNLIHSIVFSFNIAVLLAWASSGTIVGITAAVLSAITVLLFDLRTMFTGYSVFALTFFLTSSIGYWYWRTKGRADQAHSLRSEKTEEEINLLSNKIAYQKKNISSLGSKLASYSALKNVAESLSTVLALDGINKLIVEKALEILGGKGKALLFLVNAEKQELMLSASRPGCASVKTKKGDVFDQWVLRHRRSLMIDDVASDFRFRAKDIDGAKENFRSLISTPLVSENKVAGILRMDDPREFSYTQDDLRILDIIADLGAVAIENAMLYARTEELAIRDSLTGLVVRRYFLERFQEELKRAARRKGPLSLLLLDIDNFKNYNDRFGHAAGDIVLKYLAKTLSSLVREGDIVARYGGEEIMILLSNKNKKEAAAKAEKIRCALKDRPLTLRRNMAGVTVSIGLSNYPEDAALEEELMKMADERLYKAKAGGRDRVCST